MKKYEQYRCKRLALGMTQAEFAAIADVREGIITLFERGDVIPQIDFVKIMNNVETYIRSFNREKYLQTRIIEETLKLQSEENPDERVKLLSHMMIHVSKLNMMYVGTKEWD